MSAYLQRVLMKHQPSELGTDMEDRARCSIWAGLATMGIQPALDGEIDSDLGDGPQTELAPYGDVREWAAHHMPSFGATIDRIVVHEHHLHP